MRIGVIGTGISGMVSAWLLTGGGHEVTVFDAGPYIGGDTHTVSIEHGGRTYPTDTGFIVFNDRRYPLFIRLLEHLGVPARPTTMTFSVRDLATGIEWNGTNLDTLFAQRRTCYGLGSGAWCATSFASLARRLRCSVGATLKLASASTSMPTRTRENSPSGICSRWAARFGRPRPAQCGPCRRGSSSGSSTTTACWRLETDPSGARSSAGRRATSRRWSRRSATGSASTARYNVSPGTPAARPYDRVTATSGSTQS